MSIDFEKLWSTVIAHKSGYETILHGPKHWRRVERNGLLLADAGEVDRDVIRLFALFHDSRRENDGWDPGHGARGALLAGELLGDAYELPLESFQKLYDACKWHTEGKSHDDPTIAACWDADRLDLPRVGVMPDPKRMCTPLGREIARNGTVDDYLKKLDCGWSA